MSIAPPRPERPRRLTPFKPVDGPTQAAPQSHEFGDDVSLYSAIEQVVDDQGMPRGKDLDRALPLLAAWTGLRANGRASDDPTENERYQKFVECLIRLTRRDGSIVFANGAEPQIAHCDEVWRTAAPLINPRLRKALNGVFRQRSIGSKSSVSRGKPGDLPSPSANSEPAGLAVLRPTWSAPRLIVDYHSPQLRLSVDHRDELILYGCCNPGLTINGATLTPRSRWEQTCWIADDDADYLELELSLGDRVRVQRHLLFARKDEFLFVADAVLGDEPATIDYHHALPLTANIDVEPADQTREISLVAHGRRRARILPVSLNEWRCERRGGDLRIERGALELRHSAAYVRNLFAAWFIDLSPRRLHRPVTWRQLTVAEDRQIQPNDVAVGYRVQVGGRQWLFYRSLAACGNRTLLGHNLVSEFLAARFSKQGMPETLIEIEAPTERDE
jgi:hypothetical protein